jgi:hypothetical protein
VGSAGRESRNKHIIYTKDTTIRYEGGIVDGHRQEGAGIHIHGGIRHVKT